mgnify:FL=1|tara:strand:- start:317 stop:1171 length:855 start_codon:yes stop_codon:yes gene_type:complete
MKKNYLITGATGYLGGHIAEFFIKKKYNVVLFDKKKSKIFKKNKVILGNINNFDKLKKVTKNVHTIFHFAATADLNEANKKPFETIENNLSNTLKLLKACIKNKVKKIFFASSVYAISEQGGIYSTTKLASEMIIEKVCKQHNIKFIILRFGTVYGGRANKFNTVAKYINAAKTKKKIYRETKGNEVRSYIHIDDLVKLVFELTKNKYDNNHYNILGNKKFLVKDLFEIIKKQINGLKIIYSKSDKRKYNYKINPFSYRLRKGKTVKLKKYISLEKGIKKLIES